MTATINSLIRTDGRMVESPTLTSGINSMSKRRSGTCPLCLTKGRLTREDAIPVWLRKVTLEGSGLPRRDWPPKLTIQICESCNSQLGRRHEDPVSKILKPLVAGKLTTLDPGEQRAIASWVLKTDVMIVLANEGKRCGEQDIEWLSSLRDFLMDEEAAVAGSKASASVSLTAFGTYEPNGPLLPVPQLPTSWPRPALLVALGRFGYLGWQTFVGPVSDVTALAVALENDDRFAQVCPDRRISVAWPPRVALTNLDAQALADAWHVKLQSHLSVTLGRPRRPAA